MSTTGVESETKVKPMAPLIIYEVKEEEDMAVNLRADFKEKECKRLFESIVVATPPTKKSCAEIPHATPILDIPSEPKPSSDAIRPSHVPTAKPPIGKYGHPEQGEASTGLAPPNNNFVEYVVSVPPCPQVPRTPSREEMAKLLKQVSCFTEAKPPMTSMWDFFPFPKWVMMDLDNNPPFPL